MTKNTINLGDVHFIESENGDYSDFPFTTKSIGHLLHQIPINRPNGFYHHEVFWVTDGEGILEIDNKHYTLSKGQGFFIRRFYPLKYYSTGEVFSSEWVTFLCDDFLFNHYNIGDWFLFDVPDFLQRSTYHLAKQCCDSVSAVDWSAFGYMWITELFEHIFKKELSRSEQVRQYLEKNFNEPITLDMIAQELKVDKYTLCKKHMQETGRTIMQDLKRIRVRHAKHFLKYSADSVELVGKRCGFENTSYFSKNFKEETGTTPLQYRIKKR